MDFDLFLSAAIASARSYTPSGGMTWCWSTLLANQGSYVLVAKRKEGSKGNSTRRRLSLLDSCQYWALVAWARAAAAQVRPQ